MGNRTLVLLHNDREGEWSNDPILGKKISHAMNFAMGGTPGPDSYLGYGQVVECRHADDQTLALVHSYGFTPLAHGRWQPGEGMQLRLLQEAADALGYRLVKKSEKSL